MPRVQTALSILPTENRSDCCNCCSSDSRTYLRSHSMLKQKYSVIECVFFTLNRSFYPSTSGTPSVRADSQYVNKTIIHNCGTPNYARAGPAYTSKYSGQKRQTKIMARIIIITREEMALPPPRRQGQIEKLSDGYHFQRLKAQDYGLPFVCGW